VFLRFRGGKGIATTVGVTALIFFQAALISGVLAILLIAFTRYVSLGSLVYVGSLPFFIWFMYHSPALIGLTLIITLMAFVRHRQNIVNLLRGRERKI
jgi:glycerol-3-phosphate acyltransferase PlsY